MLANHCISMQTCKTFDKENGAPSLRRALDNSTCKWSASLAADDARLLPSVTVRPDCRQRLWAGECFVVCKTLMVARVDLLNTV